MHAWTHLWTHVQHLDSLGSCWSQKHIVHTDCRTIMNWQLAVHALVPRWCNISQLFHTYSLLIVVWRKKIVCEDLKVLQSSSSDQFNFAKESFFVQTQKFAKEQDKVF